MLDPSSKLEDFVLSKLMPRLYSQVKLSTLSSLLELVFGLLLYSVLSDLLSQLLRILRPGISKLPLPLKATCLISLSFGSETLLIFKVSGFGVGFSALSVSVSLGSAPGWKSGSKVLNLMSTGVEWVVVEDDDGPHWSVSRIDTRSS